MMRKVVLAVCAAGFLFACSDPEAEKVISQKQQEVAGLESQIEKTKSKLDSLKASDAALKQELDTLDMAR
ncbi:MAG: hypothetical protein K6A31_08140 [Fibrobacter sp.]|nr:hypothetical protein [Fibrobacter sp.]